jgi:hypothetical protein
MGEDNLADAIGIGPAETIEIEGKEYTLGPLLVEDLAKVQEYAKSERRKQVLDTLRAAGELVTSEQRFDSIRDLSVERDSWVDLLTTPKGLRFCLERRLFRSYPDQATELVDKISLKELDKLQVEMKELVGLDFFLNTSEEDAGPLDQTQEGD